MNLFATLSTLISLYSVICFVRVIFKWFPEIDYSKPGRILAQITDPYLQLFSRFKFLRFSSFDFTPAIAICILFAASTLCNGLASGSGFTIGNLLQMLVSMLWSIISSILTFIIIILIIRLVVYFIKGDTSKEYSIWTTIDRSLTPSVYKIVGLFIKGKTVPFHHALIISIIAIIGVDIVCNILIRFVCILLSALPF